MGSDFEWDEQKNSENRRKHAVGFEEAQRAFEDDPFGLGEDGDNEMTLAKDFLPPPEALVLKEPETEKITIVLSKDTVDFFRSKAEELDASYQRMIRNLLDAYVARYKGR